MKTNINSLVIIGLMLLGCSQTWSQSQEKKFQFEINGVVEAHITHHQNITSTTIGSSTETSGSWGPAENWGIETGVIYKLEKRHFITGRLGVFLSSSGTNLYFSPAILTPSGFALDRLEICHENTSIRMEVGQQYRFYDREKTKISFNTGLGLRYWNWDMTTDITYFEVGEPRRDIRIGEFRSYSLRPLHLDFNLGLSLIFKEFFKNVDLCVSYSFLWAPFSAYRMDPIRFLDGTGIENIFQYDNQVNYSQFRAGFIFDLVKK